MTDKPAQSPKLSRKSKTNKFPNFFPISFILQNHNIIALLILSVHQTKPKTQVDQLKLKLLNIREDLISTSAVPDWPSYENLFQTTVKKGLHLLFQT